MRLLLLGANGQLGWELQRALAPLGELTAFDVQEPGLLIDLRDSAALQRLVPGLRPDAIVNAAAYTAVDRAEAEPDSAFAINAEAPGTLARLAAELDATLVHYSTDYVFDGSGSHARDEDAAPNPLNVYGRSKLQGELAVRAAGCRHLILRTSWVYAARGANFLRTMLRLAAERTELRVIGDQVGAPTGAELLADLTALALHRWPKAEWPSGLYHATAAGETSWHGYACHAIEHARRLGLPVRVTPDAIEEVATADYPTAARRPLNSRLDTRRLCDALAVRLPPWQQGVERALAELAGQ